MYKWKVIYEDGTSAIETKEVPFSRINQEHIKVLCLIPQKNHCRPIIVKLDEKQRPIFFRKTIGQIGMTNNKDLFTMCAIGWQETIDGKNFKTIVYVYPNGSVELSNGEAKFIDEYLKRTSIKALEDTPSN